MSYFDAHLLRFNRGLLRFHQPLGFALAFGLCCRHLCVWARRWPAVEVIELVSLLVRSRKKSKCCFRVDCVFRVRASNTAEHGQSVRQQCTFHID